MSIELVEVMVCAFTHIDEDNENRITGDGAAIACVCWRTDRQSRQLYSGRSRSLDTPLSTPEIRPPTSFLCRLFLPGTVRRLRGSSAAFFISLRRRSLWIPTKKEYRNT